MKTLKKYFEMSKEQIEKNIRLLPWHRLYLKTNEEIVGVRRRKDLTAIEKTRMVAEIRAKLNAEWRRVSNAKIQ